MTSLGRNDKCACGSGKKYKQCCLLREARGGHPATKTTHGQDDVPALQQAMALHQAGRLAEAEALYRQILERHPRQAEALHLCGMVAFQSGNPGVAAELIRQAIAVDPAKPAYFYNQGIVRRAQGELHAAAESYRQALALHPAYIEAHYNLGNVLLQLGDAAAAIAAYRQTLALKPDYAAAYGQLGHALRVQGKIEAALASYRKALLFQANYPEMHQVLGDTLFALGRLPEAATSYRRLLELTPENAAAHDSLGRTLQLLGRPEDAEACYRRAVQLKSDFFAAHNNLGIALQDLGRHAEALASFRRSFPPGTDWPAELHHLTTPLVLTSGLDLTVGEAPPDPPQVAAPAAVAAPGAGRPLRVMLIYPPPWQILPPGETAAELTVGPPREPADGELGGDFTIMTYGLLTIAAQAKRAGHAVTLCNLAATPWPEVEALIAASDAEVFGISAFTANRRGLGAVAALIRQHHPRAHITAGGPFVTALPRETLHFFPALDTAVIGEGEETFLALLAALGTGQPTTGIPGTAWRQGNAIAVGPARPRIDNLDSLASPFDYFTSDIVMTSRGCPSKCTFCGSFTTWGKKLRFQSAPSCLATFAQALSRLPVPVLMIKDDTFTADRRRALAICTGIIEEQLNFLWSCDTRVDCLDDELLRTMRLAGCQTISFGVESGSPAILKSIRKETTPEMILEATRAAQKYGMQVRYYMIHLSRGESVESLDESHALIRAGRPSRYFFGPLSFYPGTEDWEILARQQGLSPEIFFRNDFKELSVAISRRQAYQNLWLHSVCAIDAIDGFNYSVAEREAVAARLPELAIVHLELANAYLQDQQLDAAEAALQRAEALGFPIPGMIANQRACLSLARNAVEPALALLEGALHPGPSQVVRKNLDLLRAWLATPAAERGVRPTLNDSINALDFQMVKAQDSDVITL